MDKVFQDATEKLLILHSSALFPPHCSKLLVLHVGVACLDFFIILIKVGVVTVHNLYYTIQFMLMTFV